MQLSDKVRLPQPYTNQKSASVEDCLGYVLARSVLVEQSNLRQEENQKKILEAQGQANTLLIEIRDLLKAGGGRGPGAHRHPRAYNAEGRTFEHRPQEAQSAACR